MRMTWITDPMYWTRTKAVVTASSPAYPDSLGRWREVSGDMPTTIAQQPVPLPGERIPAAGRARTNGV